MGLSAKAIAIGAFVLVVMAGFGLYTRWVYTSGIDSERRATVERSLDRSAQRGDDDEDLRNLDLDGLCREYGASRWVPERQSCE